MTNALAELLETQDQVADVASVRSWITPGELRWRLSSGRWQRPCRGVIVAHSGPLTEAQRLWVALMWAGRGAVLAGLTAARLDGFEGFADRDAAERPIHVLAPAVRSVGKAPSGLPVVVHYATTLGTPDVHPLRRPPRTRIARSLVDAATWMSTDRGAQAVLAAGVQQRLVRVEHLSGVVEGNQRLRRRRLIAGTLDDIRGGAHALSELDFTRMVIRPYRLPEPDRQRCRLDSRGRRRYLDAVWEAAKVLAEIDGGQHMDPLQYWDDMARDNDFGRSYRILRFPAWIVRYQPGQVAAQIRRALNEAGQAHRLERWAD